MNRSIIIRLLMLAVLIGFIAIVAQYREALDVETLSAKLDGLGVWAPVGFIALFAIATVGFLPGMVFALAGGAMFGPVLGTLYNLSGATIGAVLAFLAARYVASGWVREKTGPKLDRIIRGVEDEGWRFVAFTRLVPLFPFNLLNYALGLTRIPLLYYTVATAVCMVPGALAYTYLGYAGREAAAGSETAIRNGLIALALLAVVMFLPRLIKKIRGAKFLITTQDLKARLNGGDDILVLDVRTAADFIGDGGHIPGSRNLPVEELNLRLEELEAWRDHPMAVVCRTNKKSGKAAEQLRAQGFTNVLLVDDGMVGWSDNGFSTE
ncbi:VTT domain-containing protein [Magnetovibrio sp. PR-2]|uniref:VTT domain-containing protein n=1 Tax=Magnetovibrio sp. PR-2 TaxID=3120356 RepID=UPI002FCDEF70